MEARLWDTLRKEVQLSYQALLVSLLPDSASLPLTKLCVSPSYQALLLAIEL